MTTGNAKGLKRVKDGTDTRDISELIWNEMGKVQYQNQIGPLREILGIMFIR